MLSRAFSAAAAAGFQRFSKVSKQKRFSRERFGLGACLMRLSVSAGLCKNLELVTAAIVSHTFEAGKLALRILVTRLHMLRRCLRSFKT